jgi:hypothetical protein
MTTFLGSTAALAAKTAASTRGQVCFHRLETAPLRNLDTAIAIHMHVDESSRLTAIRESIALS